MNYGRGQTPILPLSVNCSTTDLTMLSDCFKEEFVVGQCKDIAGLDCRGKEWYSYQHFESVSCSSMLY